MRYFIALLTILFCSISINANPATPEKPENKIAAGITIHNSIPSAIMGCLNLFSRSDLKSGITQIWQRNDQTPATPKDVLPGIDLIVACNNEHILTVYGEKNAVEKLKTEVASMDVKPKQVQIKAVLVSLSPDEEKNLGFNKDATGSVSQPLIDKLKDSIAKGNAKQVANPIITTISGQPAEITVKSGSQSFRLCTLPIVNTNGTITITNYLEIKESDNHRGMSVSETTTNGITTLFSRFPDPSRATNKILVLLTVKTID